MRQLFAMLGGWFFARGDARTAAALRVVFCAVYLAMLWDMHPVLHLLCGHGGVYGTLEASPFDMSAPQFFLFRHDTHGELELFFWLSVLVSTAGMFGLATRVTIPLTYLSMFLLQERGPFFIFGADLVMRTAAIWLLFLPCGRMWSLDAALRARRGRPPRDREIELWPVRAIQIQVILIYLITGLLKLRSPSWQDGSAVYYAIQVGDVMPDMAFPWMLEQRWLMALLDYGTLLVELTMPVMLLYRPLRRWAFIAGTAMHTGIDLLMSIRFFSPAMYMGYLAFIDGQDWDRWSGTRSGRALARWWQRLTRRFRAAAAS
jgi:hypothetical protein